MISSRSIYAGSNVSSIRTDSASYAGRGTEQAVVTAVELNKATAVGHNIAADINLCTDRLVKIERNIAVVVDGDIETVEVTRPGTEGIEAAARCQVGRSPGQRVSNSHRACGAQGQVTAGINTTGGRLQLEIPRRNQEHRGITGADLVDINGIRPRVIDDIHVPVKDQVAGIRGQGHIIDTVVPAEIIRRSSY